MSHYVYIVCPKVLEHKIRPDAEIQLRLDVFRCLIFCTQTLYPAESTPKSVIKPLIVTEDTRGTSEGNKSAKPEAETHYICITY